MNSWHTTKGGLPTQAEMCIRDRPYTVQITKEEVLDLPPKQYATQWFALTEDQEKEYCRVRDDFLSLEALYDNPESPLILSLIHIFSKCWNASRVMYIFAF